MKYFTTIYGRTAEFAALLCLCWAFAIPAHAEQVKVLGDWRIHYMVLPTTSLNKKVAANYDIVRGRDRALVNISILSKQGEPTKAAIAGTAKNLLGQKTPLKFREVVEGIAVYYLAELKFTNEDTLTFELQITPPDKSVQSFSFQQKLYWED